MYRPFGYDRVYQSLCKVADTDFVIFVPSNLSLLASQQLRKQSISDRIVRWCQQREIIIIYILYIIEKYKI